MFNQPTYAAHAWVTLAHGPNIYLLFVRCFGVGAMKKHRKKLVNHYNLAPLLKDMLRILFIFTILSEAEKATNFTHKKENELLKN
jgi:hypothetical protein